jgi:hypothetical protein
MTSRVTRWLLVALVAGFAPAAAAQTIPVRFELAEVRDSTLTFPLNDARWLRPGTEGIIVDPQRRDALIASIRVVSVTASDATALITGQTTRVTMGHVAIIQRRSRAWYARREFWGGLVLGAAIGVIAGS